MALSAYLVPHPPFITRLVVEQVKLSNRMKLLRYMRKDGKVVKYQVNLLGTHRPKIHQSLLRDIEFHFPDRDFVAFLLTHDVSNLPYLGWPQRKDSGPLVRFGAYEWVWQEGGKRLVAYDDLPGFILENEEARRLGRIIEDDSRRS